MGSAETTPEELLQAFLDGSTDERLKLCKNALSASRAASECFMAGHSIEIYNLGRTIASLSAALIDVLKGEPVDPVVVRVAENALSKEKADVTT